MSDLEVEAREVFKEADRMGARLDAFHSKEPKSVLDLVSYCAKCEHHYTSDHDFWDHRHSRK